jgi:hypothetical protein
MRLLSIFEPMRTMASRWGPTKAMPRAAQASISAVFSERKP